MQSNEIVSAEILLVWPAIIILLVLIDRRHGSTPLFCVYCMIAGLAINHWFGALVHSVPWKPFADSTNTSVGFTETTIGLLCLAIGAAVHPKLTRPYNFDVLSFDALSYRRAFVSSNILLRVGILFWVIDASPLAGLPSVTTVISGGKQLLLAAICMKCLLYWFTGQRKLVFRWVSISVLFPIYTVIGSGFIGFGIVVMLTIFLFIASFYRPRWHVIFSLLAIIFSGISFWVAYSDHRNTIRASVWGGGTLSERVDSVTDLLADLGPFDIENDHHLEVIDERLNQNELIGAAILNLQESGTYADGESIYMALLALIPRAIWPDKPVTAGGMGLVSKYTNITFAEGTSVGLGPIFECYVNYGRPFVIIGMMIFGYWLRFADLKIAEAIALRDWEAFGKWFTIGTVTIAPLGSFVEIAASGAGAAVTGWLIVMFLKRQNKIKKSRLESYGELTG